MNRLECQVNSCQHFQNNQCCLMGIQVDGPAAQESSQTCCASYEERRPGAAYFRVLQFGDISHLYAHGEPPSFMARFCECYGNPGEIADD